MTQEFRLARGPCLGARYFSKKRSRQKGIGDERETDDAMDRFRGRVGALVMAVGGGIGQRDLSIGSLVIGCAVVLALLALGMMVLFIQGMRLLGSIGIVDALNVPILLVQVLLGGPMHGLVQATSLLGALDVFGFTQVMSRR
jgi:hypothetical protein